MVLFLKKRKSVSLLQMRIYKSIQEFSAHNPILTIGMFDGVHAGHREILAHMESDKKAIQGESALLTFWPHPRVFFGKADGFKMLTSLNEKLELLEQTGLDVCLVLPFTNKFANLSPEAYITEIIHKGIGARKVIVGHDHKYGKNGSGTFELMQQYAKKLNFELEQIEAYSIESKAISSTKIRQALARGDIKTANSYLSYNYFIDGIIVAGAKIGRTMGFPTANLQLDFSQKMVPAVGVYACYTVVEGKEYASVVNIGTKPTIQKDLPLTIETHLLDFQGNLYSKNVCIRFVARLRDEQQFSSREALQNAIKNDIVAARIAL